MINQGRSILLDEHQITDLASLDQWRSRLTRWSECQQEAKSAELSGSE